MRARLEPLSSGERPPAVTVAALVAGLFAVLNGAALLYGVATGSTARGQTVLLQVLVLGVLVAMAVGMWRARYWAVLGMQALLGVQVVFGAMYLFLVGGLNLMTLYVTAIAAAAGALFWFLVKGMARLQMPETPRREPRPPAEEPHP